MALPGEINRSETVISLSTTLWDSRQMFEPSGEGFIRILTKRVHAG